MAKIHNCSDCDYCYSNETLVGEYICVNGKSDYLGQLVDGLGLAEDDMDCVVIDGKCKAEIEEEEELENEVESIYFHNRIHKRE